MQYFLMMMFLLQSQLCLTRWVVWALCQYQTRQVCLPYMDIKFTSSLLKTEISLGTRFLLRLNSIDYLVLPFNCNQHFTSCVYQIHPAFNDEINCFWLTKIIKNYLLKIFQVFFLEVFELHRKPINHAQHLKIDEICISFHVYRVGSRWKLRP